MGLHGFNEMGGKTTVSVTVRVMVQEWESVWWGER